MRRPGMLVVLILAVGIVGAVVALKSHESNAELVLQQQGLAPVGPEALDALLLTTRDSRPGYSGRARAARCTSPSHSAREIPGPASCAIRAPRACATGHWQILGPARVPLAEMVAIDYLYVANWSLWKDVKILLRTVPHVLGRRGL